MWKGDSGKQERSLEPSREVSALIQERQAGHLGTGWGGVGLAKKKWKKNKRARQ